MSASRETVRPGCRARTAATRASSASSGRRGRSRRSPSGYSAGCGGGSLLTDARRRHEIVKIRERELRLRKLEGALIPVDEVAKGQFDFARRLRDRILALPGRHTPAMAAALRGDPRALHAALAGHPR